VGLRQVTYQKVNLPTQEEQKLAEKSAKAYQEVAEWLADLADDLEIGTKRGWCSSCFAKVDHRKGKRPFGQIPAYLCSNCGSPTLVCADPTCENMAVRGRGAIRVPRFCAEHRHEIPGFEKAGDKMDTLVDYREFLEYDEPNLSRGAKLVGGTLAVVALAAPAALFAAPAIGGAVGTLIGSYSGAAATSYGLALLGGGSLAAGGLGMAGGTVVVAAVGGALGGALGASVTNAYVREDKSFHIEMLQGGPAAPVVVCDGFLSESGKGWGEWKDIVTRRYPDSPVFRVHWGAKELKHLGILAGYGTVKVAGAAALQKAALAATQEGAAMLGPLGPALVAAGLARIPGTLPRAERTRLGSSSLTCWLGPTRTPTCWWVTALARGRWWSPLRPWRPRRTARAFEAAHLMGAAIGAKSDWNTLTEPVNDAVYSYYSTNDNVLKYLYAVAMGGQKAAGFTGFAPSPPKLKNIDVSAEVKRHSDYFTKVTLL